MISISVCMPVYNRENTIEECVDSILAQTFSDFELVVVDDGSTDRTVDILESYRDSRIRIIRNAHNYIDSINRMLECASGKYIARMDSDDVMMPDRLAVQFEYLEAHADVDVVGTSAYAFGDMTGALRREGKVTPGQLVYGNCIINPTTMMRTHSIRHANLKYEEDFLYAEDYRFWAKAVEKGLNIVNIDVQTVRYRLNEMQASSVHAYEQYRNAKRVQGDLSRWMAREEEEWAQKHPVRVPKSKNPLTVIIPFLNEKEEVVHTVRSIKDTVGDTVDIIVINDQSNDGYDYRADLQEYVLTYIYNKKRLGVAASRDLGVSLCRTPYFLLLDAHMRFYDSLWAQKIAVMLQRNDKCLLCCQTRFLGKDEDGNVTLLEDCPQTFGAHIPFDRQKNWPDTGWSYFEESPDATEQDIAVVLGAGYACSKDYWNYLSGLKGLIYYGCDEPYISMKVWLNGGRCILMKDIVIGHIYRKAAPYKIWNEEDVYNGLLIAYLLFPLQVRCLANTVSLFNNSHAHFIASKLLEEHKEEMEGLKRYYGEILTEPFSSFMKINQKSLFAFSHTVVDNLIKNVERYNAFAMEHQPSHSGLYDGKMALVIWLCHYAEYSQEDVWFQKAAEIMESVITSIEEDMLPWNFKHGLCGIGWALIYLYSRNFIDEDITPYIKKIDSSLLTVNLEAIKSHGCATGLGGVIAYAALRLQYQDVFGDTGLDNSLLLRLCTEILNKREDRVSCFYSYLYLYGYKEPNTHLKLEISDWAHLPAFLPDNSDYWKLSLDDGGTGTMIYAISRTKKGRR